MLLLNDQKSTAAVACGLGFALEVPTGSGTFEASRRSAAPFSFLTIIADCY
jgi:hypothetical protein